MRESIPTGTMSAKKDLLERIDEVRANSVTPEQFEKRWGYSLDDHVGRMMGFIHKLEGRNAHNTDAK